jgi:hypothetical protein
MRKILTESLFEYMGFTEEGDPVSDMGISGTAIIHQWLRDHGVKFHHYALSQRSKVINAYNTITLTGEDLSELPEYIRFNSIRGGFHIDRNNLASLRGCPIKVSGSFICSNNNLQDLVGGPEEVEGSYAASHNQLTSLQGFPSFVSEGIYLNNNRLKSLQGLPKAVGELHIQNNPIETLKGFPKQIWGAIYYTETEILNTETISKICEVTGDFYPYKKI